MAGLQVRAAGDIYPARFVKLAGDFQVAQCVAGDYPIGVAGPAAKKPPLEGLVSDTKAAEAGDQVWVWTDGEICFIEAGGAVSAGDKLGPDADGKAVTASAGNPYGAVALEAASAAGQLIRAFVRVGTA